MGAARKPLRYPASPRPGRHLRSRYSRRRRRFTGTRCHHPALPLAAAYVRRWRLRKRQAKEASPSNGRWTTEIVKRANFITGFEVLPRRWMVEQTLARLNRTRRLAKNFENTVAFTKAWRFSASVHLLDRRIETSLP